MKCWLMKSEPGVYSIADLQKDGHTCWDGVRNYQARNFMRDEMKAGDKVLFYHSNAHPPGVAGVARVIREAYPDHTAWDRSDRHYDPKTDKDHPVWMMVDVAFDQAFREAVSLETLKANGKLRDMMVTRRGCRLSIQPVDKKHFDEVLRLGS